MEGITRKPVSDRVVIDEYSVLVVDDEQLPPWLAGVFSVKPLEVTEELANT